MPCQFSTFFVAPTGPYTRRGPDLYWRLQLFCNPVPSRSVHRDSRSMPTIKFVKEKKEIQVPEGANLRNEAFKAGVTVYKGPDKILHCPGLGLCGTCRVSL